MDDPYFLDRLTLSGFRAYLAPATFNFTPKRSLAIFAPNGKGKSSLVDGLEFMFSDEGTLARIGTRSTDNQAGLSALAHNEAGDKDIESSVYIRFKHDQKKLDGKRLATGNQRTRPDVADAVKGCFAVDPIIRGYDLRKFVEGESATDRYESVGRWLELGTLVDVQHNLRDLRRKVKAAAEDRAEARRISTQLGRRTGNAVTSWNDAGVLAYANSLIVALSRTLSLAALSEDDPVFATIKAAAAAEEKQLGLEGLRHLRQAAALIAERKSLEGGETIEGLLFNTAAALTALAKAEETEAAERSTAANAIFETVWKAAEPLFVKGAAPIDTCPICATPLDKTTAGSVEGVRSHLATHQVELVEYAAAKSALALAQRAVTSNYQKLNDALASLSALLRESDAALKTAVDTYAAALEMAGGGALPDGAELSAAVLTMIGSLDKAIKEISDKQGDNTYSKVLAKIEELLDLRADWVVHERKLAELEKLSTALNGQAQFVSTEIRKKVQTVLDSLETPLNEIYKEIQRNDAMPVRLELPPEGDATQHRLTLVVDFAANRTSVQPSGYLSDSQIHSLALALRLAAIKRCNTGAPIIVLDDIVTSYDADHRMAIASMLAKLFPDFQIIITTCDERFFIFLKDRLGDADWRYRRILRVDPGYGPRFADHQISDKVIEDLWAEGKSAANEMRQAEEEWLLRTARDFGVDIRIRSVEHAFSYERAELAIALAAFLKAKGYQIPTIPGVNRFLLSLQLGAVENFGSHFQDGQYGGGSQGDEKVRWEEFKHFRGLFACPKCTRKRFKRPNNMGKPVCAHDGCEAQFDFLAVAASGRVTSA
jgi:recombinational DNA repair ATPase RecF